MSETLERIPKPVVIGVAIFAVALALFVITRMGTGENRAYGSKAEIMQAEMAGKQKGAGGYTHQDRKPGQMPGQ